MAKQTSQRGKNQKKNKRTPGQLMGVSLLLLAVLYFVYVLISQQISISAKNREIQALEEEIQAATGRTEALQAELEHMNDPEYLERVAREKLGLIRPNERVFVDANKSQANTSD